MLDTQKAATRMRNNSEIWEKTERLQDFPTSEGQDVASTSDILLHLQERTRMVLLNGHTALPALQPYPHCRCISCLPTPLLYYSLSQS